ncbi:MAG: hypothetical protein HW390_36 [Candidatus Brocadiaceae bacterium]|nr:hypothetical protein [Candidatus Brocadiaceae bacterium]
MILLKKSDAWSKMITPSATLHSLLVKNVRRAADEVRRFKLAIADLTKAK